MTFLTFLTFMALHPQLHWNVSAELTASFRVPKVRKVMRFKCFPDFGRWESQESHEFQMLLGEWFTFLIESLMKWSLLSPGAPEHYFGSIS